MAHQDVCELEIELYLPHSVLIELAARDPSLQQGIPRFSMPDGCTYEEVLAEATARCPSVPAWRILGTELSTSTAAAQLADKVKCPCRLQLMREGDTHTIETTDGGGQGGLKKLHTTLHSLRAQAAVLPVLPSCVDVYCRSIRGEFLLRDFVVRCLEGCKACGEPGAPRELMSPAAFEAHAGRAFMKMWCRSIRLMEMKEPSGEGMPIGKWLKQQGVVFAGDGVAHAHAQVVHAGAAGPTDALVPSAAPR